ncbi:MAG: TVP38/TMEM64 family protein [Fretibacterium sp.]|nr:TVP38/TMEM64 family protein [Fretibacterium sp.]
MNDVIHDAGYEVGENEKRDAQYSEKRAGHGGKIVLLLILIAAVGGYFVWPSYRNVLDSIFSAFATGDFAVVRSFVERYGRMAAVVSFFLMIFQSVMAPLPAFLITFANASLFGWWRGAILSWTSAMAGAAVCFAIARILGRDVVEKLASGAALRSIDAFFERHGGQSILIARLLPFISFDVVSYAAGLTSMKFWPFFVATGLGQLPATVIYSYVGGMLTGGARLFVTALLILFALSVLVVLMREIYTERKKRSAGGAS